MLYRLQDYQEAITVCTHGLGENPGLVSLYTIRGNAYLQLNDLDHALADFSSAIKTNPGFSAAYYCRARVYVLRKQFAEANADIEAYHQAGGTADTSSLTNSPH
jgi:tetratricopeptide (TPR) repeat protein